MICSVSVVRFNGWPKIDSRLELRKEYLALIQLNSPSIFPEFSLSSMEMDDAVRHGLVTKGDVLEASTVAAIQAVKDTPRMIPHCHIIPIEGCNVSWDWENDSLRCTVAVSARWKTGVEMEALAGVSAGLLCVWDMVKSLEKNEAGQYPSTTIESIEVVEKYKGE